MQTFQLFLRRANLVALCGLVLAGCTSVSPRTEHITAEIAMSELVAGNDRFLDGGMHAHTWQAERVVETGEFGQAPSVGVLTCADSRTPPELIFDQGVGDLFVVRVAGNFVDDGGTGTFEYGVSALGVHTIVVLGHTKCGAVNATCDGKPLPGSMSAFTRAIQPAVAGVTGLTNASEANVRWQMKRLTDGSEILRTAVAKGELKIAGAIYEVDTGKVRFLN